MFHAIRPPSPFLFSLDVLKCPCTSVVSSHRLIVLFPNHTLLYSCLLNKTNHPNIFNLRPCCMNPNADIILALPFDAKTPTPQLCSSSPFQKQELSPASLLLGFPKLTCLLTCPPVYAWSDIGHSCVGTRASQNRVS